MADASHNELISSFTGVTGVDDERAKFYLEAAGWKIDVALGSFYEDDDGGADEPVAMEAAAPSQNSSVDPPPQAKVAKSQKPKSRIATISSMAADDSSDEEEGQAYYAGGSETSGQQIVGPKKKQSADEFVQDMFKSAKDHGAETVEAGSSSQPAVKPAAFRGTGYRLGESEEAAPQVVRGQPIANKGPEQVDVVLKLWKNGFSVDSGPLRDYQNPENKDFLQSIHKGEVPQELIRLARGGEVNLNMEDHRNEDFVKPKESIKAFSGAGHMLGSPSPSVAAPSAAHGASASQELDSKQTGGAQPVVDASQPTTSLQIRLADGKRLVTKFNQTHTVSDVRQHIISSNPQYATTNFVLMTTFPNKELSDESCTLADGKLLNAVLVQRLK